MKFELKDVEVNVLHVLTSKAQAESSLYSSVKLGVDSVPDSAASALMGGKSAGEIRQAFFANGKPRFNKIHSLPVTREYLAKHMLTFEGMNEVRVTKLWKPELTLLSEGGFGLTFSVQFDAPDAEYTWLLHELQKKKVSITLVQDTNELLDTEGDSKAEAAETPVRKSKATADNQPAMH